MSKKSFKRVLKKTDELDVRMELFSCKIKINSEISREYTDFNLTLENWGDKVISIKMQFDHPLKISQG